MNADDKKKWKAKESERKHNHYIRRRDAKRVEKQRKEKHRKEQEDCRQRGKEQLEHNLEKLEEWK